MQTDHRRPTYCTPRRLAPIAGLILANLAAASTAYAADAQQAVHAKPGEIVLLRSVPTRPAARIAPPGMALIVDTKPNGQLDSALGNAELSDGDASTISAPVRTATSTVGTTLTGSTMPTLHHLTGDQSTPRGAATTTTPLSVVGNATRGVGSAVTGALQTLPFGKSGGG